MTENQLPVQSIEELNKEFRSFPEPDYTLKMPRNAKAYTVIGNTEGSNELHLINEIISKIPTDKKVFIVNEQPLQATPKFIQEIYGSRIERVVSLDELNLVKGGIINLDWTIPPRIKMLLMLIETIRDDCFVLFATGSNANGQVKERINLVAHLSNKIVVSVNKQDDWSLCPAYHLAHNPDMQQVQFALWEKINLDDGCKYNLEILSCDEMKKIDIS